jgi:hypothetical protein
VKLDAAAALRSKLLHEAVAHGPTRLLLAGWLPTLEDVTFDSDPRVSAFREGRRAFVLEFVNELRREGLFRKVYEERFLEPTLENNPDA